MVLDHCAIASPVPLLSTTEVPVQFWTLALVTGWPPVVRDYCATSISMASLSAGSLTQAPLSEPLDATVSDFLMWWGQRAVQVGQKGLPVSCIFRRSPGVAVALQSLVLQLSVQLWARPSSAGSITCTQDFFALPVTSFEVSVW